MIVLVGVVRERLVVVGEVVCWTGGLVVTGAGSVRSPSGPVTPLLSAPTDMNNGCSSSGQEVEGQETAEDDRRDF